MDCDNIVSRYRPRIDGPHRRSGFANLRQLNISHGCKDHTSLGWKPLTAAIRKRGPPRPLPQAGEVHCPTGFNQSHRALAVACTVDRTTAVHRSARADASTWCTGTDACDVGPAWCAYRCCRPRHTAVRHACRLAVNGGLGRAGPERNRRQRRQHRQGHTGEQASCSIQHFILYPSWTCRTCNDQSITATAAVADIVRQRVNIQ